MRKNKIDKISAVAKRTLDGMGVLDDVEMYNDDSALGKINSKHPWICVLYSYEDGYTIFSCTDEQATKKSIEFFNRSVWADENPRISFISMETGKQKRPKILMDHSGMIRVEIV